MIVFVKKAIDRRVANATGRLFICFMFFFLLTVSQSIAASDQSVEQRVQRLERLLANQNLIDMLTSLKALQQEVSNLRGDLDLLNHELSQIKKQQKDIYIDLDQRIQDLDGRVAKLRISPVIPSLGLSDDATEAFAGDEEVSVEAEQNALSKEQEYQNALAILKDGRYDEAIQAFQIYLISYPASDLAANAQYWMAEAYYVLKNYESAVSHFQKVITAYPDSRKISDAYLKMGFSYYELQKWAEAKAALKKVVSDYSGTAAARLATRRLDKMKVEGHL